MIRSTGTMPLVITEVESTPEERARVLDESRRHRDNLRRYEQLAPEIGLKYAGRYICVVGGELFVGDDPAEVHARAAAAHPADAQAAFSKYVSTHRGPRIHANQRRMAAG